MQAIFVNIPCPTKDEAVSLCKDLIKNDLCVTAKIHENVTLLSKNKDGVDQNDVVLITLKTTDLNIPAIHKYIYENHSWGDPCIEVISILNDLC